MRRNFCIQTDYPPDIAAGLLRSRSQGGDRVWNGQKAQQLFVARSPIREGCFVLQSFDWRGYRFAQPIFECELAKNGLGSLLSLRVRSSFLGTFFLIGFCLLYPAGVFRKGMQYGWQGVLLTALLAAVILFLCQLPVRYKQRRLQEELLHLLHGRRIKPE